MFISCCWIAGKSKNKNQGLYYLYLEGISVRNLKSQTASQDPQTMVAANRSRSQFDLFSFSPKDLEFVVKFSEEHGPDLFRQILQSICPSIYGHELVKGYCLLFTIQCLKNTIFTLLILIASQKFK